jgi:hypothetical protein
MPVSSAVPLGRWVGAADVPGNLRRTDASTPLAVLELSAPSSHGGPDGDVVLFPFSSRSLGHSSMAQPQGIVQVLRAGPVRRLPTPLYPSRVREYRLVLRPDQRLSNYMTASHGTIDVLGPHQPVLIWVDNDHRLVRLSTSGAFKDPTGSLTVTLDHSRFDLPVAVQFPPPASVETMKHYHQEIARAWGCPPKGGFCKAARGGVARGRWTSA